MSREAYVELPDRVFRIGLRPHPDRGLWWLDVTVASGRPLTDADRRAIRAAFARELARLGCAGRAAEAAVRGIDERRPGDPS